MDDDQQFCLRWNNHQSTLVAVFDTLLENEKLVDCTLAAEGKLLMAHKVVLSACSPYFESLLSRHFDKHPILILKDVKFQELKAMMDYMYRGEVNISQDQLGALLKAAESLQIKGLSDNKKDEPPAKRPAPAPAPAKSPQPQTQLPKVQGLSIEQRSRDDREDGSISPGPRKKKRMRRKSEEMENHHDASNSSDAHSLPPQNIPSATTQLPASINIKLNSSDVPDTIETKHEILTRHKDEIGSQQSQVPMIKEKLETHTELMLEPKSEYVEEMNEDSIEDLTLDDDDISNMEQQMDDGAGPSHGGEGSSQGFGHWQMGNQSQDEVFLAAQEAVGAHRDSQVSRHQDPLFSRRREQYDPRRDMEKRQQLAYYASQREIQIRKRRRYELESETASLPRKTQEFAVPKSKSKSLPRIQQAYQFSATKPSQVTIPQKPQEFVAPQRKPSPKVYDFRPINVKKPLGPTSNMPPTQKRDNFVAQPEQQRVHKPAPVRTDERRLSAETKKTGVEQLADTAKKLQQQSDTSAYLKFNKPTFQEPPKKPVSINTENRLMNQSATNVRSQSNQRMSQKAASDERPVVPYTKPASSQGSGLLTDSLSCIFTRRQHIVPQKRVFYQDVPQEEAEDKDDQLSDTESTYLTSKQPESPEKQCPEPPVISQPTPNITNEDWFATKQRILSSVNHEPPVKTVCEPQPVQQKDKCPEPPHISVDPHGFDIEPPDHMKNNVSPYVPSSSFERDEYNKYKNQQLKKEAALRQQAKQTAEAVKMVQQLASYFKENEQKMNEDNAFKNEVQQQMISPYEPQTTTSQDTFQHSITYNPTQISMAKSLGKQTENIQEYEYQQGSYEAASYEEHNRQYDERPSANKAASYEERNRHYDEGPSANKAASYEERNRHYDEGSSANKAASYEEHNRHYDEGPSANKAASYEEHNKHYDEGPSANKVVSYEEHNKHYDEGPSADQMNSYYYKDENAYTRASYNEPIVEQAENLQSYEMVPQNTYEEPTNMENMCPEAPHISETTQMTKDEPYEQLKAPEAPYISQDTAQSYFQNQNYDKNDKVGEQQASAEPFNSASAKMCHKCSFQTTNVKKLKDHLKFVHGETNVDFGAPPKSSDLFSRREPKQDEIFSRRDVPQQEGDQKKIQIKFKRRNTSALVNILSSEVVVPASESGGGNEGNVRYDSENVQDQGQSSSVLEALEYFETTKDQPKKPRPYQRNPEDNMDHDWI